MLLFCRQPQGKSIIVALTAVLIQYPLNIQTASRQQSHSISRALTMSINGRLCLAISLLSALLRILPLVSTTQALQAVGGGHCYCPHLSYSSHTHHLSFSTQSSNCRRRVAQHLQPSSHQPTSLLQLSAHWRRDDDGNEDSDEPYESPAAWLQERLELSSTELRQLERRLQNRASLSLQDLSIKEQIEPVLFWLQLRLVLENDRLKRLILKQPQMLTKSLDEDILPKLSWLEERLGGAQAEGGSIQLPLEEDFIDGIFQDTEADFDSATTGTTTPSIEPMGVSSADKLGDFVVGVSPIDGFGHVLEQDIRKQLQPSLEIMQCRLNLSDDDLSKLLQKVPTVLRWNETTLDTRMSFLQQRLELTDAQLSKLVQKFPWVLGLNDRENLGPSLDYLQERLGCTTTEISKLVQRMPEALGLSLEENLKRKLSYLEERLQLDQAQLGKLVKRMPMVLGYSIDENIEMKLTWLQERLNLDDEQLSKIMQTSPAILSYSRTNTIEPSLEWLQNRLHLDGDTALSALILMNPTLCGKNVENLERTYLFYEDCIGPDEAKQLVISVPAVLTYSLDRRLIPRLEQVQEIGIHVDAALIRRMAKYTNDLWEKSVVHQTKKMNRNL